MDIWVNGTVLETAVSRTCCVVYTVYDMFYFHFVFY